MRGSISPRVRSALWLISLIVSIGLTVLSYGQSYTELRGWSGDAYWPLCLDAPGLVAALLAIIRRGEDRYSIAVAVVFGVALECFNVGAAYPDPKGMLIHALPPVTLLAVFQLVIQEIMPRDGGADIGGEAAATPAPIVAGVSAESGAGAPPVPATGEAPASAPGPTPPAPDSGDGQPPAAATESGGARRPSAPRRTRCDSPNKAKVRRLYQDYRADGRTDELTGPVVKKHTRLSESRARELLAEVREEEERASVIPLNPHPSQPSRAHAAEEEAVH
jgi:hypothetical protein